MLSAKSEPIASLRNLFKEVVSRFSIKAGAVFASGNCVSLLPDVNANVETAAPFSGRKIPLNAQRPNSVRLPFMPDAITQCIH